MSLSKDVYFYQLPVAAKLARVNHLKGVAGQFFKVGNFEKAAKLYQRVNGYYNFGDTRNNYQKEDEASEAFIKTNDELQALKVTCFMNLVVCKHKMKQYQSVVSITDQVMEMDPNHVKCLYFRGFALLEVQEYDQAVECLQRLVHVDPSNQDGRNLFERAKKVRKDFRDAAHKKLSKMFS